VVVVVATVGTEAIARRRLYRTEPTAKAFRRLGAQDSPAYVSRRGVAPVLLVLGHGEAEVAAACAPLQHRYTRLEVEALAELLAEQ
jgi:hypothetical protein